MKIKKYCIPVLAVIAASSPMATIISCSISKIGANYDNFQKHQNFQAKKFQASTSTDVVENLNDADINLFYNGWGSITYTYMLRLALLAAAGKINPDGSPMTSQNEREVHFGIATSAEGLSHQAKTKKEEFERVLKLTNPKSSVTDMHSDAQGLIIEKWIKIIQENPNKKINVWWNSAHLSHENGSLMNKILELAGFKNVHLQLLEDGSAIGYVKTIFDNQKEIERTKSQEDFMKHIADDENNQYLAPLAFNNVYSYFSSDAWDEIVAKYPAIRKINPQGLAEQVFNTKIQDGINLNRLFKYWPVISGNNWEEVKTNIEKANIENPGKKTMLLLGSYGEDTEEDFIKWVWDHYHDQYNIFYKGHPGHTVHTNWIINDLIPNHATSGMYTIESSIPSEELTREHIADGLTFDAVSAVGGTSAFGGFPDSTYDLQTQTISMLWGKKFITNISPEWPSFIQWLKDQKYIK